MTHHFWDGRDDRGWVWGRDEGCEERGVDCLHYLSKHTNVAIHVRKHGPTRLTQLTRGGQAVYCPNVPPNVGTPTGQTLSLWGNSGDF